mmetsp:Transcript_535/g.583  ORF Transcript_535/g.583 Transcript_535/m.583 type:complete len:80 (+) Transcript_535:1841-2080(+)
MKIFNSIVKYSRIVEEVDLSNNPSIGNEGIEILSKNLARNKCFVIFKIRNVGIDDAICETIQQLLINNKVMKSFDISYN